MHQRAPLLAKLRNGALRLELASGSNRLFFVGGGFAQMKDDKLSLVTTEAVPVEEISKPDAEASLKEAEARVARTDEEVARRDREVSRARTMISLVGQKA